MLGRNPLTGVTTLCIAAALLVSITVAPASTAPATTAATTPSEAQAVVLETTLGDIVIKLDPVKAPKTSANFAKLVKQGFYDGVSFHRVIANFMIQGGDPNSKNTNPADDGQGGPGYTVEAEIGLPHVRGAVATARQGDQVNPTRASSGSQFFIDLTKLPSLDAGGYTVFGQVIKGMDAVDKIAAFASDAKLPQAGGGGRNPGKKALIKKARLAPLSSFEGVAPPASSVKPAATLADSTHH
ncbi:MAG: peptidylprolyl isomerase [Candidatus Eisenbacteria bacterium]|uniref:Peptidyl-prolyl cis-trans isomerase n=1 Tax=Eiseniibacteriota bacterium TaxID=2212470 RepID=A0A849SHQ4_UNCEI|nr:peptidylprolyl isomerase [Candidatus Eisenbacteria bacterium]